jgi:Rieske Fe-S protein
LEPATVEGLGQEGRRNRPEDTGQRDAPKSPARRRFLSFLLGFSAVSTLGMIVAPVVGFLVPPRTQGAGGGRVVAGTLQDIPANTGKVVAMGSAPVIVVNTEGGVKAFSAVCTHLGCIVDFDATTRHVVCPCHDGHFNPASGAVLSGPPPAPLPPVAVAIEDDEIVLVPGGG